ncbi:Ig-like domain-containing protein [Streptacidiphilus sp. PAMC 29251]
MARSPSSPPAAVPRAPRGRSNRVTDASGTGGTLTGSATALAATPANEAFRGVAYAPGTVTGSGGGGNGGGIPVTPPPTVTTPRSGLPAALGDPTNATLPVSVGDPDPTVTADRLTVAVTSSNPAVAPVSGITVTGSGADRTLAVTPAAVGYSTLTLTVSATDGTSSSTQIQYGVSADLGDPSQRYFSGAGNASAAIDVGGGYMLVADDESNVLRLYDETRSGPPVRSFDFTGQLPSGKAEADLETAARVGDTIYWGGSMSNNSSGGVESSRSTIFATTVTGSGADTQLSYVGGYTGLQSDLTAWDHADGHGLGADYLGLTGSVQSGIGGHENDALNVEGMEFAPGSSSTAYLSFRAPLEPTSNRHLALVVPVTNMDKLAADNSGSVHATFGAPILMDLGGLGIRDIRKNADGQYLIIAGTADGSNDRFVLYSWDGQPNDPPLATGTTLPIEPAAGNQGSWETVVKVPDPLTAGAPLQLLQDSGDVAWYGDTHTSKSGLGPDLMKSLGQTFDYTPGTRLGSTTTLSTPASTTAPGAGQPVSYTAKVVGPAGTLGTPGGNVSFSSGTGSAAVGCAAVPVDADGSATCTVSFPATGERTMTASYSGDDSFAGSSASDTVSVRLATTVSLTVQPRAVVAGQPVVISVGVSASRSLALLLAGGKVTLTVTDANGATVPCPGLILPGLGGICALLPGQLSAAKGPYRVSAVFAGNPQFAASSASSSFTVSARR